MSRLPIAVLISGGGTTLENLLQWIDAGRLDVEIRLVLSSSPVAKGLQFAANAGIPTVSARREESAAPEDYSRRVFEPCRKAGVDYVVMGGFLKHVLIPADFENRVTNIHPGLIPAFCGKGFYGLRVHQSVLDYGAKVSGCTVHFVDNEYDHGPIISQRVVDVLDDDTAESLQQRVFEVERQLYPETIQAIATGKVRLDGRRVRLS